jgi:DNA-binding NtrC family response regulator
MELRESHVTIRIGLYSEDRTLQPILSFSLGSDFEVLLESDQDEMNQLVAGNECDVMILDLNSRGPLSDRIEFSRRMIASGIPSVVLADDTLRLAATELVREGAYGHCRRPPSIRDLKTMLRRAHETAVLKRQLQEAQERLETEGVGCDRIIGSSPQMRQVYQLIESVTNLNNTVLVTGESGTGKELIARAIHNLGNRASKPFVAVSCGAIPETLIESELFGHEKGAFTGTAGAREGLFEQAGDGTIFLDEIGELSPYVQVKLLRVLQQREFSRLGSNKLIPLKARLVFATHQDLGEMVAQGKFRQDLYYRINVLRIHSPALQERSEDIPAIASSFLRQYAQSYQKPIRTIEPTAMTLLQGYSWPGNVRELENVIQRAIIVAAGDTIRQEDLPANIREESVVDISDYQPAGSFERQLRDYKIKLAANAVRESNGNKTLAARSLCISRAYLHRLIRLGEPGGYFEEMVAEVETA